MFESLTERLGSALSSITGKAKLTEENIQDALREVRIALLEADVALVVVKDFIESVKARALGIEVAASLSPGQVFIKIVNDELVRVMGAGEVNLTFLCSLRQSSLWLDSRERVKQRRRPNLVYG